jgi:hypothetical protein
MRFSFSLRDTPFDVDKVGIYSTSPKFKRLRDGSLANFKVMGGCKRSGREYVSPRSGGRAAGKEQAVAGA